MTEQLTNIKLQSLYSELEGQKLRLERQMQALHKVCLLAPWIADLNFRIVHLQVSSNYRNRTHLRTCMSPSGLGSWFVIVSVSRLWVTCRFTTRIVILSILTSSSRTNQDRSWIRSSWVLSRAWTHGRASSPLLIKSMPFSKWLVLPEQYFFSSNHVMASRSTRRCWSSRP